MRYTLSVEQAQVLKDIGRWYREKQEPYLTLGGYAGTGKTTLIAYLREALSNYEDTIQVAFCAFTGKATRVLQDSLRAHGAVRSGDSVSTIHSLIYTAETDTSGAIVGWRKKAELGCNIIIIDEASMVDSSIWNDLLSFEIPILAVGDHGQLPPVGSTFNLMGAPKLRLEHIFRQAADSPILKVATLARTEGSIPISEYGAGVVKLDRSLGETGDVVSQLLENWRADLLVLCGYNHTRVKLNQAIRGFLGFESSEPQFGDRVVCLRNNRSEKIFNGMTGTIVRVSPAEDDQEHIWYRATIALDNEDFEFDGYILREQFGANETVKQVPISPFGTPGDLFDFGYALTVHKSQGSQSPRVLLFEERFKRMSDEDWRRWLYTATTRAIQELTIVGA